MSHPAYPGDRPAPVIQYKMPVPTDVERTMLQMAGEIVGLLVNVEGDTAILVVEAPQVEKSLLELMSMLAPVNQPHGGVETFRTFRSSANFLPAGAGNLHVVVTGLEHERYGKETVKLLKTLNAALDLIGQAWIAIQVMKQAFGIQQGRVDPLAWKNN